jgi:hypothetical protein
MYILVYIHPLFSSVVPIALVATNSKKFHLCILVYICLHTLVQLQFIEIVLSYQCLWRSIAFCLKFIMYYIKGGYLQVLVMLYILYRTILQFLFFLMPMTTSIMSRTASKLMLWGFRAHFHHRITLDCIMHELEVWRVFCVNTDVFITERVAVAWVCLYCT